MENRERKKERNNERLSTPSVFNKSGNSKINKKLCLNKTDFSIFRNGEKIILKCIMSWLIMLVKLAT